MPTILHLITIQNTNRKVVAFFRWLLPGIFLWG